MTEVAQSLDHRSRCLDPGGGPWGGSRQAGTQQLRDCFIECLALLLGEQMNVVDEIVRKIERRRSHAESVLILVASVNEGAERGAERLPS